MKSTTNTIGFDPTTEAANKTDYETNYKSLTVKVTDIVVAETAFIVEKTYTAFKALIDGSTIKWTDVKEKESDIAYELHLITDSPL